MLRPGWDKRFTSGFAFIAARSAGFGPIITWHSFFCSLA
jgi:hypothetical protein